MQRPSGKQAAEQLLTCRQLKDMSLRLMQTDATFNVLVFLIAGLGGRDQTGTSCSETCRGPYQPIDQQLCLTLFIQQHTQTDAAVIRVQYFGKAQVGRNLRTT